MRANEAVNRVSILEHLPHSESKRELYLYLALLSFRTFSQIPLYISSSSSNNISAFSAGLKSNRIPLKNCRLFQKGSGKR